MYNEKTGIAIIDIYDNKTLEKCIKSMSKVAAHSYIISNKKNPDKTLVYDKEIQHEVGFSSLRNHCISHFRKLGLHYIFILTSNVIIKDPNFVENTIKTAETFGSWLLTGKSENPTVLDDSHTGTHLNVSTKIQSEFLFLHTGIVGNVGYFDEGFINGSDLDVLDYLTRARDLGVYSPNPYYLTCGDCYDVENSKIEKIGHCDFLGLGPALENKTVLASYGYFQHKHKFIPAHGEITDHGMVKTTSQNELLSFVEEMQKNYGKSVDKT